MGKGMVVEANITRMDMRSVGKTLIPPKKDKKGRPIPWTEDKVNTEYRRDGIMLTLTLELYLDNAQLEQIDSTKFHSLEISLPKKSD